MLTPFLRAVVLTVALHTISGCGADSPEVIVPTPPVVASVSIVPQSATIQIDSTFQLRADVQGSDGKPLPATGLAWASSDSSVAAVDGSGLVRARRSGAVTISASTGGKSATASVTVPPRPTTVALLAVNGIAVGGIDTIRVQDSLSIRTRVTTDGTAGGGEVVLVRVVQSGGEEILASVPLAAGGTQEAVLRSVSAPSGKARLLVRVRTGTGTAESGAVPVALSRPSYVVNIITINGIAVDTTTRAAVNDTFRVRVRVTIPDGGREAQQIFLEEDSRGYEAGVGGMSHVFVPGTTTDTVFTGYVVRAGSYRVRARLTVAATGNSVNGPRYPVVVSQSDVTPPVVTVVAPLDGSTVRSARASVTWDASDERGLFTYQILHPDRNCSVTSFRFPPASIGPTTKRTTMQTCDLVPGANRIVIVDFDLAGNKTEVPLTLHYVP